LSATAERASQQNQGAAAPAVILLTNARVIDGTGAPAVDSAWVGIEGERIAAVGRGTPPAVRGAQVIDLIGKTVVPGLGDMHVHLGHVERARWMLKLLLAHGVTTIKESGNSLGNLAGIRRWIEKDKAVPRMAISGQTLNGNAGTLQFLNKGRGTQSLLEDNLSFGVDFLKIHNWVSSEGLGQIAQFARARNLYLTGHVPLSVSSIAGIDAGMTILEHIRVMPYEILDDPSTVAQYPLDIPVMLRTACWHAYDPKGISAERTVVEWERRKDKFFVDPTLVVQEALAHGDEAAWKERDSNLVSTALRQEWSRGAGQYGELKAEDYVRAKGSVKGMATFVGQVHRRGVRVLTGTDTPVNWVVPGVSLLRELELLVESGLTPVEAIRSSTGRVAEALRTPDRDTIAVGKRADLVIVNGNLSADIRAIRQIERVMLNGQLYDRSALLADAARLAAEDRTPQPMSAGLEQER
jgi:imidazolonepropionase-like amidohydrolase